MTFFSVATTHMLWTCFYQGHSDCKESACNTGDLGSISGSRRSSGEENVYPLQYSCLENPHGLKKLVRYSPQVHKESGITQRLNNNNMCSPARTKEKKEFSLRRFLWHEMQENYIWDFIFQDRKFHDKWKLKSEDLLILTIEFKFHSTRHCDIRYLI